jgi:hypothetical protein
MSDPTSNDEIPTALILVMPVAGAIGATLNHTTITILTHGITVQWILVVVTLLLPMTMAYLGLRQSYRVSARRAELREKSFTLPLIVYSMLFLWNTVISN